IVAPREGAAADQSSDSRFNVNEESALPVPLRALIGNARAPIAGHIGSDFGTVWAGCSGLLRRAASVHHYPRHVHVDGKIHIANIDKLPARIAKLDQDIVVAFSKLTCWSHQLHRKIVHGLSGKRRASDLSRRGFVPDETRRVN